MKRWLLGLVLVVVIGYAAWVQYRQRVYTRMCYEKGFDARTLTGEPYAYCIPVRSFHVRR